MSFGKQRYSSFQVNPISLPGIGSCIHYPRFYRHIRRSDNYLKSTEIEASPTAPDTILGPTPSKHPNFDSQVKAFASETKSPPSPIKIKEIDLETLKEIRSKNPRTEKKEEKKEEERKRANDSKATADEEEEEEEPKKKRKKHTHNSGIHIID